MAGHSAIDAESEVNYAEDALNAGLSASLVADKIAKNLAFGGQEMVEKVAVFEWSYELKQDHLATSDGDRYGKLIATEQPLQREILSSVERDFVNDPSVQQKVVVSLDNASENIRDSDRRSYIYIYTRDGNEVRAQSIETFADATLVRDLLRQLGCDDTIRAVENGKILIEPTAIRDVREAITLDRISVETSTLSERSGVGERGRDLQARIDWYIENREFAIQARQEEASRIAAEILARGAERFLEGVRDQADNLNRAIHGGQELAQRLFREENGGRELAREVVHIYRPEGISVVGASKGSLSATRLDQVRVVGWGNMARWGELLGLSIPVKQPGSGGALGKGTGWTNGQRVPWRGGERSDSQPTLKGSEVSSREGSQRVASRRESLGENRRDDIAPVRERRGEPVRGSSSKIHEQAPALKGLNARSVGLGESSRTPAPLRSASAKGEQRPGETPVRVPQAEIGARHPGDGRRVALPAQSKGDAVKNDLKGSASARSLGLSSGVRGEARSLRERVQPPSLVRAHGRDGVNLQRSAALVTSGRRAGMWGPPSVRRLSESVRSLMQRSVSRIPKVRGALVRIRERVLRWRRGSRALVTSRRVGRPLVGKGGVALGIIVRNFIRSRSLSRLQPTIRRDATHQKRPEARGAQGALQRLGGLIRVIKHALPKRERRWSMARRGKGTIDHERTRSTRIFMEWFLRRGRGLRIRKATVEAEQPSEDSLLGARFDAADAIESYTDFSERSMIWAGAQPTASDIDTSTDEGDVQNSTQEHGFALVDAEPQWLLSIFTARQVDSNDAKRPVASRGDGIRASI